MTGIGLDVAEIERFRAVLRSKKDRFIKSTFTPAEQKYCLSFRDPAPHFAGTFAAKEALRKTSAKFLLPLSEVEIRRTKSGNPEVWVHGRRLKSVYISITHGSHDAFAVALKK